LAALANIADIAGTRVIVIAGTVVTDIVAPIQCVAGLLGAGNAIIAFQRLARRTSRVNNTRFVAVTHISVVAIRILWEVNHDVIVLDTQVRRTWVSIIDGDILSGQTTYVGIAALLPITEKTIVAIDHFAWHTGRIDA